MMKEEQNLPQPKNKEMNTMDSMLEIPIQQNFKL